MTQPVSNLRLRRTQKLLREALIELIEERGFEALTIGELTERAMVSRAAFYRNYQDKYDLVEQIFEEAMSALLGAVGDLGREHPPEIWVKFFEHIAEYERLYRALLGRKGSPLVCEEDACGAERPDQGAWAPSSRTGREGASRPHLLIPIRKLKGNIE